MEDLKTRILKIVSNCNKPKVETDNLTQFKKCPCSVSWQTVFSLHICAVVPYPAPGPEVWAVWWSTWWLPYRDGQQEGAGAQPAAAGGGVSGDPSFRVLSHNGFRRLTCPQANILTPLPTWACSAYQGRWADAEVCNVPATHIWIKVLGDSYLFEPSCVNPHKTVFWA